MKNTTAVLQQSTYQELFRGDVFDDIVLLCEVADFTVNSGNESWPGNRPRAAMNAKFVFLDPPEELRRLAQGKHWAQESDSTSSAVMLPSSSTMMQMLVQPPPPSLTIPEMAAKLRCEYEGIVAQALAQDLRTFIARFLVLTPAQLDIISLWVLHTHVLDAADFTPILHIHSPVLRSGKSLLLDVMDLLVAKSWLTGRTSAAALVRKVAAQCPTLLLDESDTAFAAKEYGEALRGILDSGFQRGRVYSLNVAVNGDWQPKDFPVFGPKAIAGIGRLPTTIEDRSIPIEMRRKQRDEPRERFRRHKPEVQQPAEQLRQRLEQWAQQHVATLRTIEPVLPDELNHRQQDVCEPLLTLADFIGGAWPERSRKSLLTLYGNDAVVREDDNGIALLRDIRGLFDSTDKMSSGEIVAELLKDAASTWQQSNRGKPLNEWQLAKLLKPFRIMPRKIRLGKQTTRGYYRADLSDAWKRYL